MDNRLYEFGGTADVLIKCKTARTIDGTEYKEGEPYTLLKDVRIQLDYEQHTAGSSAKKPIMSSIDGRPYRLTIGGIPLTRKITNLMLTNTNNEYEYTQRDIVTCWEDGQLQLSHKVLYADNVFCYDDDFNRIDVVSVDESLVNGNFAKDNNYLVFYTTTDNGNAYKFEIPHYAHFSIEIFAKGNTDKQTNNIYMNFDAAALITVPSFNILSGGLLNTPLVFELIYQYQKEPIVVFN